MFVHTFDAFRNDNVIVNSREHERETVPIWLVVQVNRSLVMFHTELLREVNETGFSSSSKKRDQFTSLFHLGMMLGTNFKKRKKTGRRVSLAPQQDNVQSSLWVILVAQQEEVPRAGGLQQGGRGLPRRWLWQGQKISCSSPLASGIMRRLNPVWMEVRWESVTPAGSSEWHQLSVVPSQDCRGLEGKRRRDERPTSTSDTQGGGETLSLFRTWATWYHKRDMLQGLEANGGFSQFKGPLIKYNTENNWWNEILENKAWWRTSYLPGGFAVIYKPILLSPHCCSSHRKLFKISSWAGILFLFFSLFFFQILTWLQR